MKRPYKPMIIRWRDHCSQGGDAGWLTPEQFSNDIYIESCGWKIREDDSVITLALSFDATSGVFSEVMHILKATIVTKRELR